MKTQLARLGLVAMVLSAQAFAQAVPSRVSFTANLRDASGPVTGSHVFVFTVYDAATGGTSGWSETWSSLQVNNGLVFAELGTTTPITAGILNGAPLWLEVTLDGTVLAPRVAINSVPYAVRAAVAARAETLGTLTPADVQRRVTGTCPSGAINAIDASGNVTCATGSSGLTAVNGGGGVTAATAGTTVTLGTDNTVQRRTVAPTCANSYMTAIAPDGTATCGNYTAGSGVNVSSNTIALSTCPNGQVHKSNGPGYVCADDTAGVVGTGLSGAGTATSPLTASFGGSGGGSGTSNNVARYDHRHTPTFSCVARAAPANNGSATGSITAASYSICNPGETITAGFCSVTGGTIVNNFYLNCTGFCACIVNTPCPPTSAHWTSWACIGSGPASSVSVTATAMCCSVTVN